MTPEATAALIGAGVGAGASLLSQFVGRYFSLDQDRRAQRRQQLSNAVIDAGAALWGPVSDERMSDEEFEKWKVTLNRESIAGQDPDLSRDMRPYNDGIYRAMVTLDLVLGRDHDLHRKFVDAAATCAAAEAYKSSYFRSANEDWRIANIPQLAEEADRANQARGDWMREARAEIERI